MAFSGADGDQGLNFLYTDQELSRLRTSHTHSLSLCIIHPY